MTHAARAGPASPLHAAGRVLLVTCAISALMLSGGTLAPPVAPASWPGWVGGLDAVTMLFATIRMVALVAGWYVLGITATALVLTVVRPSAVGPFIKRVTAPVARGIVQALLGVTVTAATALPSAAVAQAPAPAGAPVLAVTSDPQTSRPPPPGAPPTVERHPPEMPERPQWQVRPGDHFWSIAHEHLRNRRATEPSDTTVARYWRRLVEHNRDRLVDTENPDLLLVGQVLELPPVTPRS